MNAHKLWNICWIAITLSKGFPWSGSESNGNLIWSLQSSQKICCNSVMWCGKKKKKEWPLAILSSNLGSTEFWVHDFEWISQTSLRHIITTHKTQIIYISQLSCSVMSNSLWPHGLQHARLSCPLPTPRACSNSCPLSRWCHPITSSSVVPFSCLQSFPASGFSNESVFCITWSEYWSLSYSISPSNEYSVFISFRSDWLDLLSLQGTLKSLLQHHSSKASILWCSAFFTVQLSHPYMTTGKTIAWLDGPFLAKYVSAF